MFAILIMYAISTSTLLLGKKLLLYSSPLFLSGLRTFIAGSILLSFAYYKKNLVTNFKNILLPCIIIAISSFYLSNTLKFWAISHLATNLSALISVTEPLFVIIIAYFMFNDRMTKLKWLAMFACICSALILNLDILDVSYDQFILLPTLALTIATCASAFGALLMRKTILEKNVSTTLVIGASMLIAGIFSLSTNMFTQNSSNISSSNFMTFFGTLMIMILLSNIIAYSLYGELIKRYSALLITCGSFSRPIFTSIYKLLLFNEVPSHNIIFSAILLCLGLAIFYYEEKSLSKIALKI